MLTLNNDQLPRSGAARRGHAREQKPNLQEPETWEATLLTAWALVNSVHQIATTSECATAAVAILFAFDLYGRAFDIIKALKSELRAPIRGQAGAASAWTVTLYPTTQQATSKTRTQDETIILGASNRRRAWLTRLCPALKRRRPQEPLLIGLTASRYMQLYALGRSAAGLPPSNLHRLRHGGASADALLTKGEQLSDLDICSRGRWASLQSVRRYRQPARYLRQLEILSARQRLLAQSLEKKIVNSILKGLNSSA